MIIITCLDTQNGMAFHRRRQSRDREVVRDILDICCGKRLWMNAGSSGLFEGYTAQICVDDTFLSRAGAGEYCFVERELPDFDGDEMERLIIYRWDKKYPADAFWNLDMGKWKVKEHVEFSGYSHEKIVREIYERK